MARSVPGIYRDGKVELLELPEDVLESRVVVTFVDTPAHEDLRDGAST
jgi:hypothetical protein